MIAMDVDAAPAIAKLEALTGKLRFAAQNAVQNGCNRLLSIVQGKLSGEVLNSRSGALLRSISAEITETGNGIEARIFSDGTVPYARVQEYGGRLNIPAIVPMQAKTLAFAYEGRLVFARSTAAHIVDIPARSYMRASLDEYETAFAVNVQQSVREALE
jgi:phage gpG-like protein